MPKKVTVRENIHQANQEIANRNQDVLRRASIFSINLMASPGAGKTSLIERTLGGITDRYRVAVIDGDVATSIDAERAEQAGATAVQINTGGACHIDANMLADALAVLPLEEIDLLMVENVGNLICPASFQLGTGINVLIASIPEGDDKPYKYPQMYQGVDILIINKIDLLPHLDFDMAYFKKGVEMLNPGLRTFPLSCTSGEGFEKWLTWLETALTRGGEDE